MGFKAAFMFIAPEVDCKTAHTEIKSSQVDLTTIGVSTYEEAVKAAKELVANGVGAIELCAGFGVEGVAKIKAAVKGQAEIGVVRFDHHPAFEHKSGDDLFQ